MQLIHLIYTKLEFFRNEKKNTGLFAPLKNLSNSKIEKLKELHRNETNRRFADRIKTVLLLDKGWSYTRISEILLLDDQTIKNYESKYLEGGLDRLLTFDYKGRVTKLTTEQEKELKAHVGKMYYNDSKLLIEHVKEKYGVIFSESGIVNLLQWLKNISKIRELELFSFHHILQT